MLHNISGDQLSEIPTTRETNYRAPECEKITEQKFGMKSDDASQKGRLHRYLPVKSWPIRRALAKDWSTSINTDFNSIY